MVGKIFPSRWTIARIGKSCFLVTMQLHLDHDSLSIFWEWYEQLWAFTLDKQMRIPLHHIDRVTTAEPDINWAEIRAPGTFLPGVIKAGTYYTKRGKEFWYVTAEKNYLTLRLTYLSLARD